MENLWSKGISTSGIDLSKERQMSGALSNRLVQLFKMANETKGLTYAPVSIDPGDYIRIGDDGTPGIALSLPIAYDVWYLWKTVNAISDSEEDSILFIQLILNPFLTRLGGVKPLRMIPKEMLVPDPNSLFSMDPPDLSFFQTNGFPFIKQMRFETFLKDRSPEYSSPGPQEMTEDGLDQQNMGPGDLYSGYLAFPVGSLGVMETISFVCGSLLDVLEEDNQEYDGTYDAVIGDSLLPPAESLEVQCKGLNLYEKAYLKTSIDVEYPAATMQGQDSILPHHWLRLWLDKENTYPIPGEFVGITVKPLAIPPHCWWFQETSPLLYSGNWFETDYYTSGIVLAVINNVDEGKYAVSGVSTEYLQRTGYGDYNLYEGAELLLSGIGNIYKVRVKDQDLYLKSTDFKEYQINERVAIVKGTGINIDNFNWTRLTPGKMIPGETVDSRQAYDLIMSGQLFEINSTWVIAPITFYED
ncbi:MAG: hypothetical protein H8D87_20180 [Deltaproteobacteria bacterium]|uniref:hypothetical protein n=1 Tax=Desulfobacula sp. TaxID=2593537 RepID=UPI0019B08EAE|nr:hypothetical protein [Candidatus Desulfobacula maris]MBL6992274.1 hypothetical protein [Desulfobacula sp.]